MPAYGVVIYGSTPNAIMCACAAAQYGIKVALIAPPAPGFTTSHLGGMSVNGLSSTDGGSYSTHTIGSGVTGLFFNRNSGLWGGRSKIFAGTPSTNEMLFKEMLGQYRVDVCPDQYLSAVSKTGTTINSISTLDAATSLITTVYTATNFHDGTYEGDLIAMLGITLAPYRREAYNYFANTTPPLGGAWLRQNESIGGFNPSAFFSFNNFVNINPYSSGTTLAAQINPFPALATGAADNSVQAYGFRPCLTQRSDIMTPFVEPVGPGGAPYDPTLFLMETRALGPASQFLPASVPNGKADLNTDYVSYAADPQGLGVGIPAAWCTATRTQRGLMMQQIYLQQMGFLYFLANDVSLNGTLIQNQANQWGLARDEFTDNTVTTKGWPREVYVREGLRPYGQYVMTQNDIQIGGAITKTDTIAVGCYSIDSHPQNWLVDAPGYLLDQTNQVPTAYRSTTPYDIPYRSILPLTSDCVNLTFGCSASFSHVAYCSLRVEHTWMSLGEAAGVALGLSASTSTPLNSLNVTTLQNAIVAEGGVIHYSPT